MRRSLTQGARRRSWHLAPYLFLAPALIWYLVFLVYPMYQSLVISFMDWDGLSANIQFVGLENYRQIFFADEMARLALRNNILWTIGTLLIPTTIGLLLAVALDRKLRGRNVLPRHLLRPGGAAAGRRRHDLGLDVQSAVRLCQRTC